MIASLLDFVFGPKVVLPTPEEWARYGVELLRFNAGDRPDEPPSPQARLTYRVNL